MTHHSSGDDRTAILIFGASARAAAQSAARAGLKSYAADLFGDVDLQESTEVFPLGEYPNDFVAISQQAPHSSWMYTGGVENYASIVSQVSAFRPLWGNPAEVLTRVRDPFQLQDALRAASLPTARLRSSADPPPSNGKWLLKPIAGAGGSGITLWDDTTYCHQSLEKPHYFQEWLTGRPISAVFLKTRSQVHSIGVTRQFVGSKSMSAGQFSYCGSLGPCHLPADRITRIGQFIGEYFQLRGLFGIDLMWNGKIATPIEVNPRYVASVEVLERALEIPLIAWHQQACDSLGNNRSSATVDQTITQELRQRKQNGRVTAGKAILFARHDLIWPSAEQLRIEISGQGSQLADIPQPGTAIPSGRPICTVLTQAQDQSGCLRRLNKSIRLVKQFISAISCS